MKPFRFGAFAIALIAAAAMAVPALADGDNWLIGTWSTTFQGKDATYTFSDAKAKVSVSGTDMEQDASYTIDGDKITVALSGGGMDANSIACTKTDDSHASCTGAGGTLALTKQ